MESLREAMKYMVESQGFDRVLRKVQAGCRGEGGRAGGRPAGGWPLAVAADWRDGGSAGEAGLLL